MHGMVALLPMRANSERVPKKNFKEFKGKPLFYWILEKLLAINEIDKVIINTDGVNAFKEYSITADKRIILRERKPELRGEFMSMNRVLEDDVHSVDSTHFLMTHSTNPLLSIETINRAISAYYDAISKGYDSLFSVNRYQSRFYDSELKPVNHDPSKLLRTQDLPPLFEENSCLYLFNQASFKKSNARIGNSPFLFETPFFESVDIDTMESWNLAELVYEMNK